MKAWTQDFISSSDEEEEEFDESDTDDAWVQRNDEILRAMYENFMAHGTAWFGSGFYRTGGFYKFALFTKRWYDQRHLF